MQTHVAILKRPYLQMILSGRKTVESRLTRSALPPFGQIAPGDRIYFKVSAGPFMGYAEAADVAFYDQLTPEHIATLEAAYNASVCGERAYWEFKRHARFATFVSLHHVARIDYGPRIAPSRGPAWFVLDKKTARTAPHVITIPLTGGAIRNNYLRLPRHLLAQPPADAPFPPACFGTQRSRDRPHHQGQPITLTLPDGRTIESDLVANGMFRWRGWGPYFEAAQAGIGHHVVLAQTGPLAYRVAIRTPVTPPALPADLLQPQASPAKA